MGSNKGGKAEIKDYFNAFAKSENDDQLYDSEIRKFISKTYKGQTGEYIIIGWN